jgi:hypothetical protein
MALEELKTLLMTTPVMVPRRRKRPCSTSPHPPRCSVWSRCQNNMRKANPTLSSNLSTMSARSFPTARSDTHNPKRCCTHSSSPRASSGIMLLDAQDQGRLNLPLGEILRSRDTTWCIVKLSVELGQFDLEFCPRQAIKSQILADFVSEWTETQQPPPAEKPDP